MGNEIAKPSPSIRGAKWKAEMPTNRIVPVTNPAPGTNIIFW